ATAAYEVVVSSDDDSFRTGRCAPQHNILNISFFLMSDFLRLRAHSFEQGSHCGEAVLFLAGNGLEFGLNLLNRRVQASGRVLGFCGWRDNYNGEKSEDQSCQDEAQVALVYARSTESLPSGGINVLG